MNKSCQLTGNSFKILPMSSFFLDWFALDRDAGISNLIWRWLTAHITHFSAIHALLNLAGMLVIAAINRAFLFSWQGGLSFIFLGLWVSAGIWLFNPEIVTYAGLSGVLHGLFVLAIVRTDQYRRAFKAFLLLLWMGKVLLEQSGYTDLSSRSELLGVAVAVDAHLYGLVGGMILILLGRVFNSERNYSEASHSG